MTTKKWLARTKRALMIEVWEYLDCESVGARELEAIQREVGERFGAGAVESPAAIARALADEGAVLRHPEVLECDTAWRESLLLQMGELGESDFSSLQTASEVMQRIDVRRRDYLKNGEEWQINLLREFVLGLKEQSELRSTSMALDPRERAIAQEIMDWLTVWLQDPELFADWLSLRLLSSEFLERFGSH